MDNRFISTAPQRELQYINFDLTVAFTLVFRFLSMLEEEVYSQNSPIWDQDFLSASSRTSQLGIQTGKKTFCVCVCVCTPENNQQVFVLVHSVFLCVFHQEVED